MSSSFSSSASYSYSSSSSSTNQNGERTVTGQQTAHQRVTDDSGNTYVRSVNQNLGEPAVESTRQFDSTGRELVGNGNAAGDDRRIEDVSEQQARNDREYEERMEEE